MSIITSGILAIVLIVALLFRFYKVRKNPLIGKVHQFVASSETRRMGNYSKTYVVWRFTVERYDANRNPLQPIPVEMVGERMFGLIREGDEIELPGTPRKNRIYTPRKIYNHTLKSYANIKSIFN